MLSVSHMVARPDVNNCNNPALKCDLREDPAVKERLGRHSLHPVTYDEGLATARAIRASRYLGGFSRYLSVRKGRYKEKSAVTADTLCPVQSVRPSIIGGYRRQFTRPRGWQSGAGQGEVALGDG